MSKLIGVDDEGEAITLIAGLIGLARIMSGEMPGGLRNRTEDFLDENEDLAKGYVGRIEKTEGTK